MGREYSDEGDSRMVKSPTESAVVNRITAYLKTRDCFFFKTHGSRFQHAGIPDLYFAEKGVQAWFEVKKPVDSYGVTALQKATHLKMQKQKVPVFIVVSVEEVKTCLLSLKLEV